MINEATQTISGRIVADNTTIHIPPFFGFCTGLVNRLNNAYWEKKLGISTSHPRGLDDDDAEPQQAVPYHVYFRLFEQVGMQSEDVIVDLGSGEGRMLCSAALYPVKHVIGIEQDAELHRAAKRNIAHMKNRRAAVSLICQSVTDFDFDGVTTAFLFNSFGPATMRRVVDNLRQSVQTNPREVRIVCSGAVCSHFADETWVDLYDHWKVSPWSRIKTPVHFLRTKE